jgi:hypothetical protein
MKTHPSTYQRTSYDREAKYRNRGDPTKKNNLPDYSYLVLTRKYCQEVDEVDGYEYSPRKKKWFHLEWKNKRGVGETCFMYCVGAKRRYMRHLKKCDLLAGQSEKMRKQWVGVCCQRLQGSKGP